MIIPKKSLGQNFLIDQNVINKIVDFVKIKDKKILEIGPGTGNLTSKILTKLPKKFIVVEKDNNLSMLIKKKFGSKVEVINKDILKINENNLDIERLVVFGNLPYNISTEILCKWILNINDKKIWFESLILMFQKEVADRIISEIDTKNYGRLSILSNWKLDIKKIMDIKPSSFFPKPKIQSTLLFFTPKKKIFKMQNPKNLEKVTRIFFSQRRKMIRKPYNLIFNGDMNVANKLRIDLNQRPQNLDYETYYKLTSEFEKLRC